MGGAASTGDGAPGSGVAGDTAGAGVTGIATGGATGGATGAATATGGVGGLADAGAVAAFAVDGAAADPGVSATGVATSVGARPFHSAQPPAPATASSGNRSQAERRRDVAGDCQPTRSR
jgi:hypothetical protein